MIKYKIKLKNYRIKTLENVRSPLDENSSEKAKKKANVILLRNEGKTINQIIKQTGLSKGTIITYCKDFLENDLHAIHGKANYKNLILKKIENEIQIEFKTNKPTTYKEATERIEKLWGIKVSESTVRRFLQKKGIKKK